MTEKILDEHGRRIVALEGREKVLSKAVFGDDGDDDSIGLKAEQKITQTMIVELRGDIRKIGFMIMGGLVVIATAVLWGGG